VALSRHDAQLARRSAITPKVVWDACRAAAVRAGLTQRVSAHTLRSVSA
jgi:site-specific recombinase XerD